MLGREGPSNGGNLGTKDTNLGCMSLLLTECRYHGRGVLALVLDLRCSPFVETLLTPCRPQAPAAVDRIIIARQAQKTALNPSNSACGEFLSVKEEPFETELDMIAMTAILIEMPSWATVWYTAPASACVSGGNMSVMTRLATVKLTIARRSIRIRKKGTRY